jgi:hypothetical protein
MSSLTTFHTWNADNGSIKTDIYPQSVTCEVSSTPLEAGRLVGRQQMMSQLPRKELLMPTELVLIGGILVVAAGGLFVLLLRRQKVVEPPHFR